MAADEEERLEDDSDLEAEEDEFEASDGEEVDAELDDIDVVEDGDVSDDEDIEAVVALSSKEQSARNLEIRRAIEERMEERRFHEDFDYLDLDSED